MFRSLVHPVTSEILMTWTNMMSLYTVTVLYPYLLGYGQKFQCLEHMHACTHPPTHPDNSLGIILSFPALCNLSVEIVSCTLLWLEGNFSCFLLCLPLCCLYGLMMGPLRLLEHLGRWTSSEHTNLRRRHEAQRPCLILGIRKGENTRPKRTHTHMSKLCCHICHKVTVFKTHFTVWQRETVFR